MRLPCTRFRDVPTSCERYRQRFGRAGIPQCELQTNCGTGNGGEGVGNGYVYALVGRQDRRPAPNWKCSGWKKVG